MEYWAQRLLFLVLKYPAVLSLLLAVALPFWTITLMAQSPDVIVWTPGRKLKLSDFKVASDTAAHLASNVAALTRTGIIYYLTTEKNGNRPVSIRITVQATVHKNHSFVRQRVFRMPADRQQRLLNHEQKHFDISEIYAREATQQLRNLKLSGKYQEEIRRFVQEKFQAAEAYQRRYDAETRNGEDFEAQKEWDKVISARLQKLQPYQKKVVVRNL